MVLRGIFSSIRPIRRDSDATLVCSPTAQHIKPRASWESKSKARTLSEGTLGRLCLKKTVLKRINTQPLPRQIDDNSSFLEHSDLTTNDGLLVCSPIGEELSPPSTAVASPSSTSFSTPSKYLQKRGSDDKDGMKDDSATEEALRTARSTGQLVVQILLRIADASNIPYLKGAAGVASLILDYVDVSSL